MSKKIKMFAGVVLVVFSVTSLAIAVLKIWEVISSEEASEAFSKTAYTFGAVFIAALVILLVTSFLEEKK